MRPVILAILLLTACGPSRFEQEIDAIVERATAEGQRIRDMVPSYVEQCRAIMPQAPTPAVTDCARDRLRREFGDLRARTDAELTNAANRRALLY